MAGTNWRTTAIELLSVTVITSWKIEHQQPPDPNYWPQTLNFPSAAFTPENTTSPVRDTSKPSRGVRRVAAKEWALTGARKLIEPSMHEIFERLQGAGFAGCAVRGTVRGSCLKMCPQSRRIA